MTILEDCLPEQDLGPGSLPGRPQPKCGFLRIMCGLSVAFPIDASYEGCLRERDLGPGSLQGCRQQLSC